MSEYERMHAKAEKNGWKIPATTNSAEMRASWLNYWRQCEEYARNPNSGRPVIPHRSA